MKKTKLFACMAGAIVTMATAFAGEWDIKVFRPAVNPRDKNDVMVRAGEKYTAETGGKVTYVLGDWGTVESKVLSGMAAGDPIDVVFVRDADFPKFQVKGYLQPIDGYVNTNMTVSGTQIFNFAAANNVFKYNGKYYAASHFTSNHAWLVIYNKTLMDEVGIKESEQPEALYKAGKWTWDAMAKLARKLTADTSRSGSIDRWGLGNWNTRIFAYMNGTEFTKNNHTTLNFDDPKITAALSYLQTAKTEGWYQQDNSIVQDGLANRTVAMVIGREYDPATITKKTRDKLGYVPLPTGPNASKTRYVLECDGYGIGAGSKKQKAAGKYIEYALKEWYGEDIKGQTTTWPKEMVQYQKDAIKEPYYPGPSVAAIDSMLDSFLGEVVWSGNSPASAVEKWTPKAKALLADANKPMGKLERLPFTKITQDFEKVSSPDGLAKPYEGMKSAKVSITSKGIKGKSLEVKYDPDVDGEEGFMVMTDATKLGIVGWREYKVEFDVKVTGKVGKNATVYAKAIYDELHDYGWISKAVSDNTTVYHVTGNIKDVNQNGRIGIAIGGKNIGGMIIDNIVISER